MTVRGDACLYRMSALADTEDTIPDTEKVEFVGLMGPVSMVGGLTGSPTVPRPIPIAPDGRTGLVSIEPIMGKVDTDNEQPFAEQSLNPDTGYKGTKYKMELMFNQVGGRALAIQRLRNWTYHLNSLDPDFEHGRIGFRNDAMPEFNIRPTGNFGYRILAFAPRMVLMHPTIVRGTLILLSSGPPAGVWTESDV